MIKIVTDSTAHLPNKLIAEYGITVVPLKVLFGENTYREGIDLSNMQFYRMLREARRLPTTTQPSAGEFRDVYARLAAEGHSIISVHLSSQLSGTVSSAETARHMLPDANITIIDTPWISLALGMMVVEASKAAAAGWSHEEILNLIQSLSHRMNILFVVDTLEYLQKGGRIGGAQAWMGTLLQVKPILHLHEGRIEPLDRVRTKRAAVQRLIELAADRFGPDPVAHIAVLHANTPNEANTLTEAVRERFKPVELYQAELGPVVGAHTGPGTVGLAFYSSAGLRLP